MQKAPPIEAIVKQEDLEANPVYLVSAELPGCGSSSVAKALVEHIHRLRGKEPGFVEIGQKLRELTGAKNDEDLREKMHLMEDPTVYDPKIYEGINGDPRPYVVDGKLATTAGPKFINPGRPLIGINLESDTLTNAKRIASREGEGILDFMKNSERHKRLIGRMATLTARSEHDMEMRGKLNTGPDEGSNLTRQIVLDTRQMSLPEITDHLAGNRTDYDIFVPDWEMDALCSTQAVLSYLHSIYGDMNPNDERHYTFHLQSIGYNTDRLTTMLDPEGMASIREELRKAIIDCSFSLLLKKMPRFFQDANGNSRLDEKSHKWTPEYYKIAEGWPFLSSKLKDKKILDPFAGAGTFMYLLAARNIPKHVAMTDKCFPGGSPIDDDGNFYAPQLNRDMASILFDDLPSWYKPDFSNVQVMDASDSRHIDVKDKSLDYIVADPPYGKNCEGGIGLLLGNLAEFNRVAKEGSILLVPLDWKKQIRDAGYELEELTGDVSRGTSGFPVCYVHVKPHGDRG